MYFYDLRKCYVGAPNIKSSNLKQNREGEMICSVAFLEYIYMWCMLEHLKISCGHGGNN